jgi:hypothetical protein
MTVVRGIALLLVLAAQNALPPELGSIQGIVTRTGSADPIANAEVVLEGGVVDPVALQSVLNAAANLGIPMTPTPGASLSEVRQALVDGAAARGVPVSPAMIQNLFNQAVGGRKWPTTTTDRDGRFTFKDVTPARYTVRSARDGYFGKSDGGTYAPSASVEVTVRGRDAEQAQISMVQGGIIGGRISDASGEILANVNVQAFSVGYANAYAQLQPAVSKTTDERGEYRLLWIPPGEYYVGVTPRVGALAGLSASVRTFYPGVTSLSDSRTIVIRGGEDLRGIDIGIRPSRGFKISGKVTSSVPLPTGPAALPNAVLMLVSRGLDVPDDLGVRNLGNVPLVSGVASFEISGIPSGSYELFARVSGPAGTGAGEAAGFAWGHVPVDVRDSDSAGIAINVASSVDAKGTVRSMGTAKLPPAARIVLLAADSPSKIPYFRLISIRNTSVDADGSFTVSSLPPGRYRVGAVSGLPPDLYLADVRQNATSVFDSGFEIDSRPPGPIEITIGQGAGVIEGVVQESPVKTVAGATVALVPESRRLENRALYATATADASGRFVFRSVPPGDYRLLSWESTPPNASMNVGFIQKYESRGRPVHVSQGSTVDAVLTLIR